LITHYTSHTSGVVALEYINENTIASSAYDQTIKIWILNTGVTIRTFTNAQNQYQNVFSLKLLTNGIYLAAGLSSGDIFIYNINDGSQITTLYGHTNQVNDFELIMSNEYSFLASSSSDLTIRLWNLTTNTCKFIMNGHSSNVIGLKFISSSYILASSSEDYMIKLWNITSGQIIRTLAGHLSGVMWSIDLYKEQTLISGSYDYTIKQWSISTGSCLNTITTSLTISSMAVLSSTLTTGTTTNGICCF
jgi:WD40 repeat protein